MINNQYQKLKIFIYDIQYPLLGFLTRDGEEFYTIDKDGSAFMVLDRQNEEPSVVDSIIVEED